jgi:hypothetical protein
MMAEKARRSWKELCQAALAAQDPDELLTIVQDLNRALKHEEEVRRDFRLASGSGKTGRETPCL